MNNLKLEQIAYSQGWVEGRLEGLLHNAEPDEKEEFKTLYEAFKIVSDGFDEVRRENQKFERTLLMIRGAVQL